MKELSVIPFHVPSLRSMSTCLSVPAAGTSLAVRVSLCPPNTGLFWLSTMKSSFRQVSTNLLGKQLAPQMDSPVGGIQINIPRRRQRKHLATTALRTLIDQLNHLTTRS